DNDKRSDGAEAELIDSVATRWVVAVDGKVPKRVYSDPRYADADLDGLADGDEYGYRSDPGVADTDGDGRLDGADTRNGLSPLAQDSLVTVSFAGLWISHDGDDSSAATDEGDIGFDLGVRLPDRLQATGLSASLTHALIEQTIIDAPNSSHD